MLAIDLGRLLVGSGTAPAHPLAPDSPYWRVWPIEPLFLAPVVLAGVLYAVGLRRWRPRSRAHPWWRTALFYLGLLTMVGAVDTPLHALAEHHFSAHMVQHLLVMTVGVPLVLLGAPTTPVLRGMPRVLRRQVLTPLAADPLVRGVWRGVTHPLSALLVFTVVMVAWHLVPGWYDRATEDAGIHELQHISFVVAAGLYWWNLIDPAPLHAPLGYLMRIIYVVAQGTVQSLIAAFITLADHPLYHFYERATPVFQISPIDDQELGGLIMWVPGQMLDLIVVGVLFAVWWSQAERGQREADERSAAAATSNASTER
jgi:putative membrane protein